VLVLTCINTILKINLKYTFFASQLQFSGQLGFEILLYVFYRFYKYAVGL